MVNPEIARLQQEHDELLAENADLKSGLPKMTPEQWVRQAGELESQLDEYPDERVDILCDAANAWVQAGDLEQADRCYRLAATEDVEPGFPDPRAYYASFVLEQRDAAQGYELLAEIWRSRPTEPSTYHYVAETLEHRGDHQQALKWSNAGLSRCYSGPVPPEVEEVMNDHDFGMLLSTRFRVRQALDQPVDSLDELNKQVRDAYKRVFSSIASRNAAPAREMVLYWPEAEWDEVVRRWPDSDAATATESGSHTEYRRGVERDLRGLSDGTTPVVVWGEVAGFIEFCRERELDGQSISSRNEYTAHVLELGHRTSWPPGRNDPCWCESRRKYKKCCGAPGFVDLAAHPGTGNR